MQDYSTRKILLSKYDCSTQHLRKPHRAQLENRTMISMCYSLPKGKEKPLTRREKESAGEKVCGWSASGLRKSAGRYRAQAASKRRAKGFDFQPVMVSR